MAAFKFHPTRFLSWVFFAVLLIVISGVSMESQARNNIRSAFFDVYPYAEGTVIETVPSNSGHCGVCHLDFDGGGTRNPYGLRLEVELDLWSTKQEAVIAIQSEDPDGDGFSTLIEVTDLISFINTPSFPGLTPGNAGSTSNVDLADIQDNLVPSTGGDTTPPEVVVLDPNGGEVLVGNGSFTVQWFADDPSGIAGVSLYVSLDNGATFELEAPNLANSGSHTWYVANRPTTLAIFRVVAIDNAFNEGQDDSDNPFTIESPPGGIVPTTLRDFDMPGTQPFESGILNPPEACEVCHGGYDTAVEPFANWEGSMMSQASRDVIFLANMVIANQDAPDSGDLCLRCHYPRGWLQGRGSTRLKTRRSSPR